MNTLPREILQALAKTMQTQGFLLCNLYGLLTIPPATILIFLLETAMIGLSGICWQIISILVPF